MQNPDPSVKVLLFDIGRETYGVRLGAVREIYDADHVQHVPRAPDLIRGVTDVRGRMVTVIDLPALVAAATPEEPRSRLLILTEPLDHIALWSPSDIDLLSVDLEGLEQRPGQESDLDVFEGYVSSSRAIINLLSTEKILLLCEQEVLKRYRVAS